jgi:NTE family protein
MPAANPYSETTVGIALSGGGVRAAAFHAGVLQYLAEKEMLESVVHVSSVSGGSLFMGLLLSCNGYQWPSSSDYIKEVLPKVRKQLTRTSLQRSAIFRLIFNPFNWRYFLSRANVMAQAIQSQWGIDIPLSALSSKPIWSINGTTAETGRRFRFKDGRMGDYELGYAEVGDVTLAAAMAVSAAFPGGIGPLFIKPSNFHWHKRESWESTDGEKPRDIPFDGIHLYDGGLYDNLGMEPLFDMGKQVMKPSGSSSINYLIVADAGAALSRTAIPHPLNPLRFKRIADIALDQTRALRVRSFVSFLLRQPESGLYLQMGVDPVQAIQQLGKGNPDNQKRLLNGEWLGSEAVRNSALYPTTLGQMNDIDFQNIARHGYETAQWNRELHDK